MAADEAERASGRDATPEFFELLGIAPLVGRTAARDEDLPDAPPTAVVSVTFASTRLGAPSGDLGRVLGTTIQLDDVAHRVIGVLPERIGPMASRTQVF